MHSAPTVEYYQKSDKKQKKLHKNIILLANLKTFSQKGEPLAKSCLLCWGLVFYV